MNSPTTSGYFFFAGAFFAAFLAAGFFEDFFLAGFFAAAFFAAGFLAAAFLLDAFFFDVAIGRVPLQLWLNKKCNTTFAYIHHMEAVCKEL